jgi:hypothetical protein
MSRSYAPTELKRRLKPALEELEQLGFLEPLSADERYSYVKRGTWRIILIRGLAAQSGTEPLSPQPASELVEALKARGVTGKTAAELVENHPATRIQTKIEVFDWLLKNEDKRVGKNPAGYLVASIRADYQAPNDFPVPGDPLALFRGKGKGKGAPTSTTTDPGADAAKARAGRERKDKDDRDREATLRDAWDKLPDPDRDEILATVKAENPGLARWRKMLEPLCLAALETRLNGARQKTLFDPNGD